MNGDVARITENHMERRKWKTTRKLGVWKGLIGIVANIMARESWSSYGIG